MTTVTYLLRQVFVKENLRRARSAEGCPGNSMTLREVAKILRVDHTQILHWEDPFRAAPERKRLMRVVHWIEKRLRIKAPS